MVVNKNYKIGDKISFIPKDLAFNMEISPHARSLLFYMLSMPCETVFNFTVLQKISGYTDKRTKQTIKELVENGYMKSIKEKDSRGCFIKFDYIVTYIPFAFSDEDIIKYNNGEFYNKDKIYDKHKITKNEQGFIYVIKIDNYYKIGKSKNIKRRFGEYTRLFKEPELVICEYVNNYDEVEIELHEIFGEKRTRGEWFMLSKNDIKRIKSILREDKAEEKSFLIINDKGERVGVLTGKDN